MNANQGKCFEKIYRQTDGIGAETLILRDRTTGVCYLWHRDGYAGGLTVLLQPDGKPVTVGDPLPG